MYCTASEMSSKYYEKISKGGFYSSIPFSSSIGTNLLQKMGWSEGKGLGKEEKGIQECIQINKKSDNLGLGATLSRESSSKDWTEWWKDAYNDVANKLHSSVSDSRYQDLSIDSCSTESECENSSKSIKSLNKEINQKKKERLTKKEIKVKKDKNRKKTGKK
ncbi:hypothetical protein FG386_000933 [Cryptosporidium ryanae]|uniref:uncharacterized protein n=1 Tax=Cryptosporidium ryanae TaxID=515981 RepID=UPI00351A8A68|nr:hypothetical protein FG386_000933 [Cryptosporidium ryanae]